MNRDIIRLASIAAVLILALIVGAGLYLRSLEEQASARVEQVAAKDASVFVRMHSPTRGPVGAPVTLVEFMDPQCESCRAAHPMVEKLLAEYPDQVRLVIRYVPLHHDSMQAIGALEAAREQGRFDDMLDVLFANQGVWGSHQTPRPDLIPGYAEQIGLDMPAFRASLARGAYRDIAAADRADAEALGVRGTPTFFLNGRPVPRLGYDPIKAMIDAELAQ